MQFWESFLDSGAHNDALSSRLINAFSRIFGLAAPAIAETAPNPAAAELGPLVRFARPTFDTVTTAATAIVPDDDIQLRFTSDAPAASAPTGPDSAQSDDASGQSMTVVLESIAQPSFRVDDVAIVGTRIGTPQYAAVVSDLNDTGYVYDTRTKELLPGGPGDYPQLFGGSDAKVMLSGDYSEGAFLEAGSRAVDSIELLAGNSYSLIAPDELVQAGQVLNVSAATLGEGDHFLFDGSAETDGMYFILGSDGGDVVIGGAGDDRFYGLGGGDALAGGGGSDIFIYWDAGESSGTDYDTIADFDPAADRIDLPGAVSGFADPIESGALSTATFNADLAAALGGLAPSQAVWFAPDQGDLAGQIFLIVDGNGQAGYQEGEDFVIAVGGSPLADLTGYTDIFI
jgi:Ca2+-binding RTX toxin-like protein